MLLYFEFEFEFEFECACMHAGVADSIESDIDNLMNLLAVFDVAPHGLFLGEVAAAAKKELALECDYRCA